MARISLTIVGKLGKTRRILIYLGLAVISWKTKVLGDKAYMEMRASQKLRKPKLNSKNKKQRIVFEE